MQKHKRKKASESEIDRVISFCPNWLRPVLEFAYGTGMRLGEIVNLKWYNIDFQKAYITSEMTMSGKTSEVKLNRLTLRLLKKLSQEKESGYIFCDIKNHPLNPATVRRVLRQVVKNAGLVW